MRSTGSEDEPHDESGKGDHSQPKRSRGRDRSKKKGSFWKELPILIVTALVLTILIQAFLARVYIIPSQSMEQTLHGCPGCNNDRILVDKVTYRFTDPAPGDVVVFRGPETWGYNDFQSSDAGNPVAQAFQGAVSMLGFGSPDEKDFVKRVIAREGQTVACCDAENRVTVDGQPLDEPYIFWEPGRGKEQEDFAPVTVPENKLWVMGDNRNDSADSRVQGGGGAAGAVPEDNVIGKARFIVLPPTRWQGVPDSNPQNVSMPAPLGAQGTGDVLGETVTSGLPAVMGVAGAFPAVMLGRKVVDVRTGRRSRENR